MEIRLVKLSDIKAYENNTKLHPEYQIEAIKNSIREFGFNDPIALDADNMIIEGHGRYLAAKALELEEIPAIYLDNLSEEQIKAYTIIHNKLTLMTDFDMDKLNAELELIENIDMDDFGFTDFDDIFADYKELESLDIVKKTKTKKTHKCPSCGCEF